MKQEEILKKIEEIYAKKAIEGTLELISFCSSKQTFVRRTELDLNICDDLECPTCTAMREAIKKVAK